MVKTAGLYLVPVKGYSKNGHPYLILKRVLDASTGVIKRQITEILVKENNQYKCRSFRKSFKPQGITYHIKSCTKSKTYGNQNKID
jgi:hypothetical protein